MADTSVQQVPFSSYTPNVAIVTGGAQGMGYAIAHRLADDGMDIAINDIYAKQEQINAVVEEIRKKGRRATAVPGDVSSEIDVTSMIEKTVHELGSVDVMVANAGIAHLSPLLETSIDAFDRVYAVNARSVFLCFKYAASQMIKQGRGGRMIAASSVAGKQGAPTLVAYSASKYAVRGIAQCASAEMRRYGITVNTYAPGPIRTPMFVASEQESEKTMKYFSVDAAIGEPENIASIVSYFAKPESYFINGQCVTVDGGTIRFD